MPSLYPAPSEGDVEACLMGVASAPARVTRLQSAEPEREPVGVMVEYVTEGNTLAAIAFADHDAVNFVGGAVAAVEATTIQETNSASTLHDAAVDAFRRVADALGTGLNGDYTPAVHVAQVHQLPGELSEEIKQLWRAPRGRRAYRVTVDEYGAGTVILYLN
ncbi:MAG TPA: hypothetical protein VL119_10045 [Acidimicrobiia bacterium]|nr:hypothetical protein [Acidimicrobiia bacterium]